MGFSFILGLSYIKFLLFFTPNMKLHCTEHRNHNSSLTTHSFCSMLFLSAQDLGFIIMNIVAQLLLLSVFAISMSLLISCLQKWQFELHDHTQNPKQATKNQLAC